MDHRSEHHTPGCQKYIRCGSAPPVGGRGWVSPTAHSPCAGVPTPTCLQTYLNRATLCISVQLPDVHKGVLSCRQ